MSRLSVLPLLLSLAAPGFATPPPASDGRLAISDVRLLEVRAGSPSRRLVVRLRNTHAEAVSRLAFTVRNDGVEVPVYRSLVFLDEIPAGSTADLELYRLPESGRVEVELREAWRVEIAEAATERRQRPLGPVPGLPVSETAEISAPAGGTP